MNLFHPCTPESLNENPFSLIGKDWMLITAGTDAHYNTMTASWGGVGVLWNKNVCFCFIRPQRHTLKFLEEQDRFTLSFFPDGYRDALTYCGRHSGRDVDKAKETGLTPHALSSDTVTFEEARLVLTCKKLYLQDMTPESFLDPSLVAQHYPNNDFHKVFVAEIESVYTK